LTPEDRGRNSPNGGGRQSNFKEKVIYKQKGPTLECGIKKNNHGQGWVKTKRKNGRTNITKKKKEWGVSCWVDGFTQTKRKHRTKK